MWSHKAALAQAAVKIAKEKHPEGFNKAQLIDCSKEVNGGFSVRPYKAIKTMEDVNNMGNHMANIDGHYPTGMSGCEVVGINGGCGLTCPVFLEGDCDTVEEFHRDDVIKEYGEEEAQEIFDMYSHFEDDE